MFWLQEGIAMLSTMVRDKVAHYRSLVQCIIHLHGIASWFWDVSVVKSDVMFSQLDICCVLPYIPYTITMSCSEYVQLAEKTVFVQDKPMSTCGVFQCMPFSLTSVLMHEMSDFNQQFLPTQNLLLLGSWTRGRKEEKHRSSPDPNQNQLISVGTHRAKEHLQMCLVYCDLLFKVLCSVKLPGNGPFPITTDIGYQM